MKTKKKMNEIIIKSNNFLSPSYSFYLFKLQTNNNMNENISIKDYEIPSSLSEITQRKKVTNKNTNFSQVFDPLILSLDYSLKKNNIIPTDLKYMFYGCSSLISIFGISEWNTNYVTEISNMFEECSLLAYIDDISQWKFKELIDMSTVI